jgi:ubiquinone/menaquinone biosynthesis C-methylase UbiE
MATYTQHLPTWLKKFLRISMYRVLDLYDSLMDRREPMVPPRITSLIVGSGNFIKIGKQFLEHFIKDANLSKESKVLEIGAGYGRMAVGLSNYIISPGSYDGIEIIPEAVAWCHKEITSRYAHFHFHHADLANPYSNPKGSGNTQKYTLPFEDNTFDFVFLTSVFSHLKPNEISSYLHEIYRVLKKNSCCFITYYLLDDYAINQINKGKSSQPFNYSYDGYLTTSRNTHENTIAHPEEAILKLYKESKLEIKQPVLYGSWSGRAQSYSYQDVIIAHKL